MSNTGRPPPPDGSEPPGGSLPPGAPPAGKRRTDIKRTQLAQQGLDVATLFMAKYMSLDVGGYKPLMREPSGVSTEGGKQATQHIVLEPKVAGDPVITIGSANLATKTAKLRTYDCLETMHKLRFAKRPFMLVKASYLKLFDDLLEFFRKHQLQVEIETRPPDMSSLPPPAGAPARGGVGGWIGFAVVLVIAAALVWLIATGRLHLPKR